MPKNSAKAQVKPTQEYVSVNSFLKSVQPVYRLSKLQVAGFKGKMAALGMDNAPGLDFYLPYLREYLELN